MTIFPNVPNVPGVPPLPRIPGFANAGITLLVHDLISLLGDVLGPQWGLFLDGFPAVIANSVVSFDFKRDWTIADYPIERGAFQSYDKVQVPFEVRLRFSSNGTEEERQDLLDSIAAIAGTLDLFDAVTPEEIYENVNVHHYDYRRTAQANLGMIVIDVWCVEVRQAAAPAFTNTQAPAAAATQNTGTVQATQAAATGGIGTGQPLRIKVGGQPTP